MRQSDCINTMTHFGPVQLPPRSWRQWLAEGARIAGRDVMHLVRIVETWSQRARERRALMHLVRIVETWSQRARERRALMDLDDRMMKDIGISRADVFVESSKPFWRA